MGVILPSYRYLIIFISYGKKQKCRKQISFTISLSFLSWGSETFSKQSWLDATSVISDWWLKDLRREFEEIRNVFKYAVSLAKAYALINNCIRNFSLCDLKPCFDEFSLLESAAQDRNKRKTTCNIEKLESIWIELELIQKALLFFMWCFTVTEI